MRTLAGRWGLPVPILLLLIMTCAGALAFTLLGLSGVRQLVAHGVASDHNEAPSAIFQAGGTIYAVFLAFLVVTVWESHEAAHANVSEEASLLSTLYRGSSAMEPQSGGRLRTQVRAYTRAVIDDEWALQSQGRGASEAARAASLGLFRVFAALSPSARQEDSAIDNVQLGLIAQVQADRNKRTLASEESISPVIWMAAVANGVFVVVMSFFLYADRDWPHIVMSGILATMIAMLLSVIFILDHPFSGLLSLPPDAFRHSLGVYDSVDRTP